MVYTTHLWWFGGWVFNLLGHITAVWWCGNRNITACVGILCKYQFTGSGIGGSKIRDAMRPLVTDWDDLSLKLARMLVITHRRMLYPDRSKYPNHIASYKIDLHMHTCIHRNTHIYIYMRTHNYWDITHTQRYIQYTTKPQIPILWTYSSSLPSLGTHSFWPSRSRPAWKTPQPRRKVASTSGPSSLLVAKP